MIGEGVAEQLVEKTTATIAIVHMKPYHLRSKQEGMFQLYREYEAGGLTPNRVKEIAEQRNDRLFSIAGCLCLCLNILISRRRFDV